MKLPDQLGESRDIRRSIAQLSEALATELAKRVIELRGNSSAALNAWRPCATHADTAWGSGSCSKSHPHRPRKAPDCMSSETARSPVQQSHSRGAARRMPDRTPRAALT